MRTARKPFVACFVWPRESAVAARAVVFVEETTQLFEYFRLWHGPQQVLVRHPNVGGGIRCTRLQAGLPAGTGSCRLSRMFYAASENQAAAAKLFLSSSTACFGTSGRLARSSQSR